jgi:prepilin-type N-terminal cleavage/methylation domain-containing protein
MGLGASGQVRVRSVPAGEDGYTLIELLVVLAIIGILLAVAIPSYLGYGSRAADDTAKANIRAVLPAVEAYYSDNNTYAGMTIAKLRAGYDSGIASGVTIYGSPTATVYCVASTQAGHTWSVMGPGLTSTPYKNNGTCA